MGVGWGQLEFSLLIFFFKFILVNGYTTSDDVKIVDFI